MTFLTNYNVSDWGMTDVDRFMVAVIGWSYGVTPESGQVYGDYFAAVTLPNSIMIANSAPTAYGYMLEWTGITGWRSVVQYSTNLVTMPFTDLSAPMAYPLNAFTDTVHGAESECFYKVEMVP